MRILALPAFKNRRENPYNASLYDALRELPGTTVEEFTNRRVFTSRWDILHIHWPDAPLHRRTGFGAAAYTALLIARVIWAKLLGAKIVWTVHNLRSHHVAHPVVEKCLWKCFVPLVDACIHLSRAGRDMAIEAFTGLAGKVHTVVPHGHYRGAYLNDRSRSEARDILGIPAGVRVVAFVGQIKAYKNVPDLIRAFLEMEESDAHLIIAGRPGNPGIERELHAAAAGNPRVHLHLALIREDRMQIFLNACDLTVFPYRDILNSGSAILSLSFGRPALVPARGAMAELRGFAGADWVYTYEGRLSGALLATVLDAATATSRPAVCDLTALEWPSLAVDTVEAYSKVAAHGTRAAFQKELLAR